MIKIIVYIFLLCTVTVLLSAQSKYIDVQEIEHYDFMSFYGRSVDDLISTIDTSYRVSYLISNSRNILQGVTFVYSYNDSMDVRIKVYVQEYKYIIPSGKDRYFLMDDFMKETTSKVEIETQTRLSEKMEKDLLELMEQMNAHYKKD